jgi:hypothetical protein
MEDLGASDLPEPVIRGRARRLQHDLEEVDSQIAATKPSTYGFRKLLDTVENWSDRAWIETLVDHVTVKPAPRDDEGRIIGRSGFDPSRVEVEWR